MVNAKDLIRHQFESGHQLLDLFISDLDADEFFVPPCTGGNHAVWIIGHIATTEDWVCSKLGGGHMRLDEGVHRLFNGRSACVADASMYPRPADIEEMFRAARAHTVETLTNFDEQKWNDPTPEGVPADFFPTLGALWTLLATHQFWHIGQLTAARTAMKKQRVLTGGQ